LTYRKFDNGTWQDPWFESLKPLEKYSFVYLFTNVNCTPSGIYNITPGRFEFDTGIKMFGNVEPLSPKVEWFKDDNTIWVKSFFKHQCQSPKYAVSALNGLKTRNGLMIKFVDFNRDIFDSYASIDLSQYINRQ
jgi:hypothetical protein